MSLATTASDDAQRGEALARVVFVTGKGGVGKTTVAAGLARALDAALVELGDGEAGARALGVQGRGVVHEVIRPEQALVDAATPLFGSRVLTRLILGNFAVRRLASASPGLREMALLEATRLLGERHAGRRLIVDLPATGHGLAWLRVPRQFRDFTATGPLHRLSARLVDELLNPDACSVVVVTLPEPMVLSETVELCATMASAVGLPVARLIVNRVPLAPPPGALRDARALAGEGVEGAAALARLLAARAHARGEALEALARGLERVTLRPVLLPEAPTDPALDAVAAWLREGGAA